LSFQEELLGEVLQAFSKHAAKKKAADPLLPLGRAAQVLATFLQTTVNSSTEQEQKQVQR
jgi:hypothetical protein